MDFSYQAELGFMFLVRNSAPNSITEIATSIAEFLGIEDGMITLFMIRSLPTDALFSLLG